MGIRESTQKHKDCSTTTWICLEKENHHFMIDFQAKLKKEGKKQTSLDAAINLIISEKRKGLK